VKKAEGRQVLNPTIPEKLIFLLSPCRYKVARGGRGSGKSWTFARTLIGLAARNPLRILCAREVQNSIRQSVHKLLSDQIEALGIGNRFVIKETEIIGINGSEFQFTGLSQLTVDSIKSFEGVDICWVEEGQVISKRSWDILIPTIRKAGSEIWISYNPDLESDETHQRFTVHPPHGCANVLINWRDNPWFNAVLEAERRHCQETDPDGYNNIWEGQCRPAVEGAIYHREIGQAEADGRVCNIPHDPMLLTHLVFDLGWDDSLAVGLVQRHTSEIRLIEYIEVSHTPLPALSIELRRRPYTWGRVWLPHDGFAGNLNSGGKSTADILRTLGWDVALRNEISILGIEDGIRQTRIVFPRLYFDRSRTGADQPPVSADVQHTPLSSRLIECVKRYRRRINRATDTSTVPLKDLYAHGCDMLRYVAVNADQMEPTAQHHTKVKTVTSVLDSQLSAQRWFG
jgi:phage terminase large subunit